MRCQRKWYVLIANGLIKQDKTCVSSSERLNFTERTCHCFVIICRAQGRSKGGCFIVCFVILVDARSLGLLVLPWDMQYMICLGTLSPAARQAAKDAEKLMAISMIVVAWDDGGGARTVSQCHFTIITQGRRKGSSSRRHFTHHMAAAGGTRSSSRAPGEQQQHFVASGPTALADAASI